MRAEGDSEIKIYGLFGFPLAHTVSPAIQNKAMDIHGLRAVYFAFERSREQFHFLMQNLKSLLLSGFNVTVPYKEQVIPYLDKLHPTAKEIGAVNTVKREGKIWVGYNTDFEGFLSGLKEANFNPKNKKVVLIGSGGAARAVCFGLAYKGVRQVVLFDQVKEKSESIVKAYKKIFPSVEWLIPELLDGNLSKFIQTADLLINATPVGLHKEDPLIVQRSMFPKRRILVYDLIYKPRMTKLLKLAKQLGHGTINGETMLLMQGAKAFEIWTGKRAPVKEMRKALHVALSAH